MSVFERYLTIWVFLCIVIGIALGQFLPGLFSSHWRPVGRPGQLAPRP
jgi:ACR3 family arsenite efflux pump ArsB